MDKSELDGTRSEQARAAYYAARENGMDHWISAKRAEAAYVNGCTAPLYHMYTVAEWCAGQWLSGYDR